MSNAILNKCKTKQVILPAAIIIAIFTLLIPMISANSDGIKENAVDIAKLQTNFNNLDKTITKLDNSAEDIDDAIVNLKLVICDVSDGKHC